MRAHADPRLALGISLAAALALLAPSPPTSEVVLPVLPAKLRPRAPYPPASLAIHALPPPVTFPVELPEISRRRVVAYLALDAPGLTPDRVRVVTSRGQTLPVGEGPRAGVVAGHWGPDVLAADDTPARVEVQGELAGPRSFFFCDALTSFEEPHPPDHLRILLTWWQATPPEDPARQELVELLRVRFLRQQLPDTPAARRLLVEVSLDFLEQVPGTTPGSLPPDLRPLFADLEPATRELAWTRLLGDADRTQVAQRVRALQERGRP